MRIVLPRSSMLADFGQNAAGAATDEVFAQGNAELMGTVRIATDLSLYHDRSREIGDQTFEADLAVFQNGMTRNRHLATAFKSGKESAFRSDRDARRHMVENGELFPRGCIVVATRNPEGSLSNCGQHKFLVENLGHDRFFPQSAKSREREDDAVELSIGKLAQPGIDVPA